MKSCVLATDYRKTPDVRRVTVIHCEEIESARESHSLVHPPLLIHCLVRPPDEKHTSTYSPTPRANVSLDSHLHHGPVDGTDLPLVSRRLSRA